MYLNKEKIKKYFQKNEIKMSVILLGSILLVALISILSIDLNKKSNTQKESKWENLKISNNNIKKDEKWFFLSWLNKKIFIKDDSFSCFEKNDNILGKKVYEDLILKRYKVNKSFLKCIFKIKDFWKFKIKRWDMFITKNNQIVLYNGTYFTWNNIIKIDWHY